MRKPQFSDGGIKHATINGHRFHLRCVDETRDNFLWIDGQQPPLVLDQTAADFMSNIIDGMWQFQRGAGNESDQLINYVVEKMFEKYGKPLAIGRNRVTRGRIRADLHSVFGTIMRIAEGNCPVIMGLESKAIDYGQWVCPARMDLAITHRCNLSCSKCYLNENQMTELTTDQWIVIYKILWDIGIPQIVFTGGEPTLREDLIELVSQADEFVTGLITNGTELAGLAPKLVDASLDYVQVTIESCESAIHDSMTQVMGSWVRTSIGIREALKAGLSVVTNTTITRANAATFIPTMKYLAEKGVENIACNTLICSGRGTNCKNESGLADFELVPILQEGLKVAEDLGLNFQWYSPTCYVQGIDPVELGFGPKSCSAAAHNMTIEPNGDVLPCQSWPESVGNILKVPWPDIWEHPTCLDLRDHLFSDPSCDLCKYKSECGGGCPLDKSPRGKES